jgi:F-type H+-transporting ATPase subunit gamma
MANLRDIRRRIKSVKNTAQITKAMQMVAASKMRRAQESALAGRPFAQQFNRVLTSLLEASYSSAHHPLLDHVGDTKPCVLLISTDKGLCGGLNTNLLREVSTLPANTVFVTIGRKGRQFLVRTKRELLADFEVSEKVRFSESKQISKFLIEKFLAREITSVSILYPRFVNTLIQATRLIKLVPMADLTKLKLEVPKGHGETAAPVVIDEKPVTGGYEFEPEARAVLDKLLPYYIHFLTYQTILNARASEHSARMVAMKSATDNAKQMVKDLSLEYNKARQAAITKEILEIATAQMAMS